ncbi:DNA polymerase Y family protein [Gordonia desulfuricans]|uniref:DNA polymerase Y family protein n=1 Tax=Gordonia desulfuricans TaxID=89051 RepID=A0A7K3LUL6_9ACTN|nr:MULTISPECIES: DNA polymerase Y family protein [Gordonia]EMP10222.2 DNA polymerase [Gordonia sp. NB41Y]NDK91980.1 DNA polymerase Y family protein [Gordonia desulfuricans]WLP91569.1 DNA polymerase Y family protein [Gordonia sp. NB41Y]
MAGTRRVAALWCPDWPATAAAADAELPPGHPIAVLSANRVIACSASARAAGIRRGMRKRQAQSSCPEMTVVTADDHRDGRMFEPVAAAVADLAPTMEVLRPGLLVVPASGATRFHGGEENFAELLVDRIAVSGTESQVGIADELFTAVLAARSGHLVPAGGDRDHLAGLPIAELAAEPSLCGPDRADLVDLLRRLGLTGIGAFAALSATDVGTRFGADAIVAHRQARGEPGRPPSAQALPADLSVEQVCDPPIDRIDAAAFAGRRLAEVLHRHLRERSVACTILTVEAITERGQRHSRTWRCAQPLTPAATADRIRWQLEGWMTGGRSRAHHARPDSPIGMLRLVPAEVVDAGALQQTLTAPELPGGAELSERARRSMERVQGLLGGDAVRIPVRSGGRGPFDQITLVALDEEPTPERDPSAPWPGRIPHPVPTVISESPIELVDLSGQPVRVTDRGAFTTEPTTVRLPDRRDGWELRWWAGPWPTGMETGAASPVSARAQVLLDDSRALLLAYRSGGWMVEGIYE